MSKPNQPQGFRKKRYNRGVKLVKAKNGAIIEKPKKKLFKKHYNKEEKVTKNVDPRSSRHTVTLTTNQVPTNMNPSAVFDCDINPSSMVGPILSVVSYALSRGYQQYVSDNDPFYAAVYMSQYIIDRMANITPKLSKVPFWLACLADAFTAKTVKCQAGWISYRYKLVQLDASNVFGPTMQIGPQAYTAKWNAGAITNTTVNNFWHIINVNQTYNETDGEKAYASLSQWLAKADESKGELSMHRLVSSTFKTRFIGDASAFCVVSPNPGGGFYDSGGFMSQLQLEIPPRSPIFAGLCPGDSTGLYRPGRYPKFVRSFAGDLLFTGGMLANILTNDQLHMKKPASFHFVDFLEFLDVVAKILVQAAENAVKDGQVLAANQASLGALVDLVKCPLTLQEVGLVLRATMMNAFAGSQYMTQGLFPVAATNTNDNQFVAFACGVGTCPTASVTQMLLPTVLVENIRSLTMRINVGHRGSDKNPAVYMPILGQYHRDVLDPNDYIVAFVDASGETTNIPIFNTTNEFKNVQKDIKTGREVEVGAEISISYVDGLSGSGYLAINDPGGLNDLILLWNEYVAKLSTFLRELTTVGTDAGIDSLYMGILTSYWQPVIQPQQPKDKRLAIADVGLTYSSKQLIAYSSSEVPFKANWETIQSVWIAPTMKINAGTAPKNESSFQRIAAALGEVIEIPVAMTSTASTLGAKHTQLATLCVKSRNSEKYAIGEFFTEEAKKGRGGILSSIASSFVPILAQVAQGAIQQIPY